MDNNAIMIDAMSSCKNIKVDWSKPTSILVADSYEEDHKCTVEFYNTNAESYNEDFDAYKYMYPKEGAAHLHQFLKGRVDSRILDIGAGTGLASAELKKLAGYNNVEGLDPAPNMLAIAQKSNLYAKTYVQGFTVESGIKADSYDGVISCGTMISGHLRAESVKEMIKIIKPDGFVCLVFRGENMITDPDIVQLRPIIVEMVNEGKCTVECDKEIERGFMDKYPIHVFVLRKL